jgi:putative MATE family efflux protein
MQLNSSYKQIWQLAYPLMLGSVAQNITNLINTAFLGRVSEVDLGAAAIAGVFYFSLTMIALGLGAGAQIIIARKTGEKKEQEVGAIVDHNFYMMVVLGLVLYIILEYFSPYFLRKLLSSDAVYNSSIRYLHYRNFGVAFSLMAIGFRALYSGIAKTKVVSIGIIIMSASNIVLDYMLIFGHFGFSKMGIAGAGVASTIAEGLAVLFYLFYTFYFLDYKQYNLFKFTTPDFSLLKRITSLSLPMVFQYMISVGAWFLFFVVIEQMGEHYLAISNVLRSLYMLLMTPIWGYAAATTILVSNVIGQGKQEEIVIIVKRIIIVSLISSFVVILGNIFVPHIILSAFTEDAAIIRDAISSLYIISVAMLLFSVACILLSAVSGMGDTKASLIIEILAITIYGFYIYYVAFQLKLSLPYIWASEFIYWIIIGSLAYLRLRAKNWSEIKSL